MEYEALRFSKRCRRKIGGEEEMIDRLSDLPLDILFLIMSSFTMKELAVVSLVSRKWRKLLAYFPCLNFDDPRALDRIMDSRDSELIDQERYAFIRWVNKLVEGHQSLVIDEFKVTFDLGNSFQSLINNWVAFALEKKVKKLEFNFKQLTLRVRRESYNFPLECFMPLASHHNLTDKRLALKSVCLKYVNICDEAVERLLYMCPFLEDLYIEGSDCLTKIIALLSSLALKRLAVYCCRNMKIVDISSPKLLYFGFHGAPEKLHIRNAASLVQMSVGGYGDYTLSDSLDSLSKYFSQLEFLRLSPSLYKKFNLGIYNLPYLTNLKHLEFAPMGPHKESLLGWIPFLETCPFLQKLTFRVHSYCLFWPLCSFSPVKRYGCPFKCLKTLDIIGFVGCLFDLQFATYVVDNAIALEEVIVSAGYCPFETERKKYAQNRAMEFGRKLPQGVNFRLELEHRSTYYRP